MIDGAIYADGNVVLRYHQPTPKYIQIGAKEYVCSVKSGVSLAFVPEQEVPLLLGYRGGCCGGHKQVFSLCSQEAYTVYSTGDR